MLQNEIDTLAKQYGGRSVPAHLTLMGGIVDDRAGAEERAKSLAEKLRVWFLLHSEIFSGTFQLISVHVRHPEQVRNMTWSISDSFLSLSAPDLS